MGIIFSSHGLLIHVKNMDGPMNQESVTQGLFAFTSVLSVR